MFGLGAGYVRKIGAKVASARPDLKEGDPVLLAYPFCRICPSCKSGHPAYCYKSYTLSFGDPGRSTYKTSPAAEEGEKESIVGEFFGQSSLGDMAVVKECCINSMAGLVNNRDELALFAPLGCGFETGAGTVTKLAVAQPSDSVAILGLGGVGLAAVMVLDDAQRFPGRIHLLIIDQYLGCQDYRL